MKETDYMQALAIITEAYKAGARSAPAGLVLGFCDGNEHPRRCIFCNGSQFVERIVTDYEDNYTILEVVCEDCGMPTESFGE